MVLNIFRVRFTYLAQYLAKASERQRVLRFKELLSTLSLPKEETMWTLLGSKANHVFGVPALLNTCTSLAPSPHLEMLLPLSLSVIRTRAVEQSCVLYCFKNNSSKLVLFSKFIVFEICRQKMCRFRVNGMPIRHIFHRFQNVPASCERSLIPHSH